MFPNFKFLQFGWSSQESVKVEDEGMHSDPLKKRIGCFPGKGEALKSNEFPLEDLLISTLLTCFKIPALPVQQNKRFWS